MDGNPIAFRLLANLLNLMADTVDAKSDSGGWYLVVSTDVIPQLRAVAFGTISTQNSGISLHEVNAYKPRRHDATHAAHHCHQMTYLQARNSVTE
jgi:hypothetical protein